MNLNNSMKNFQVMIFNAVILIGLGFYGYIISSSPTSFISVAIGAVLLILSFPVRNDNHVAAHIAVGLTGLSVVVFFIVGFLRGNNIILIMAVVTLIAFIFYISDFLKRKKERESNN
ncbi:MAG: hypothetical protein AB2L26_14420 [Ignavibacteria bacterium]